MIFSSCSDPGTTTVRLQGDEKGLPEELKGLKIYSVSDGYGNYTVSDGYGNYIKVSILENQVVGTSYMNGKHKNHLVYANQNNEITITVPKKNIIVENDSIMVIKKK